MFARPPGALDNEFLGDIVQFCLVTRDYKRTLAELTRLGIGPWRIQTLGPHNVTDGRLRGDAHEFTAKMCYAYASNLMFEVVQPLTGQSAVQEFLDKKGEGIHHLGCLCPTKNFQECIAEFEARGFKVVQSGRWQGKVGYAFIGTDDALGFFIEIWDHPPGFVLPEPEEWYPAPPSA